MTNNQTQNTTQRTLTSSGVARLLSKAGIPQLGSNKLTVVSRRNPETGKYGNTFAREDGTLIRIFNVLAFRSIEEATEASASWKEGTRLEKAGDIEGAQPHFRNALNKMMSFSVLEQNADAYEGAYEVTGIIEAVPAGQALQDKGTMTVLGFNQVRPVAVNAHINPVGANLFTYVEEKAPKTKKAGVK